MTDRTISFSGLLINDLVEVRRVYGGGNSEVYYLRDSIGNEFCGKVYAVAANNRRSRLVTEWESFSYLCQKGIECIPKPIASSVTDNIAVYEWIEGLKLSSNQINSKHIDSALNLMSNLETLGRCEGAASLCPASEACFSLGSLESQLYERIKILRNEDVNNSIFREMRFFLADELEPAIKKYLGQARERFGKLLMWQELPLIYRVLSPSDFGFHNAIVTNKGIVWIDFEYFGWDDPAKIMVDFVLHPSPQMDIGYDGRKQFWQGMIDRFAGAANIEERARCLYPLFGIKWCLIILNEFLPGGFKRRTLAGGMPLPVEDICEIQLIKAKKLLQKIKEHDASFPY